jgi:hypothetical protein
VLPDGDLLHPDGSPVYARFAVGTTWFAYVGHPIAQSPQLHADREGLVLWRLTPPLRLSTITTGVEAYGQLEPVAALHVYGCREGVFRIVLLVKQAQTIRLVLDGRLVRRAVFIQPTIWRIQVPIPATSARASRTQTSGICLLKVETGGLTDATTFDFDRAT